MSTMKILPVPFAIATCFGIWEPIDFSYRWKKRLYRLFSIFVMFIMYTFVVSQIVEVISYFTNNKGISETLYVLLSISSACYKIMAFLMKKRDILSLRDILLSDHCVPANTKEVKIQKRFDNVNRYVTKFGLSLVYGDILLMAMAPLLKAPNERNLPYKTWLPYNAENSYNYWWSYVHQIVALICSGSLSTAIDNIVTGFMWQACAQFDILEHRFQTLPELIQNVKSKTKFKEANELEKNMLIQHLQHQNQIYLYVKKVVNTFSSIIFVQFCVNAMGITFSIYQLSITSAENLDFLKVLVYLIIMLVEFLMYCWFGNEVNFKGIKFAENVYQSNWMVFNLRSRKMILFLIHRCSKPIVISCYNMVVLSLHTYVQILKLSYSAYNLLRKSNGN